MKDYYVSIPFEGVLGITITARNLEFCREEVLDILDQIRIQTGCKNAEVEDDVEFRIELSVIESE